MTTLLEKREELLRRKYELQEKRTGLRKRLKPLRGAKGKAYQQNIEFHSGALNLGESMWEVIGAELTDIDRELAMLKVKIKEERESVFTSLFVGEARSTLDEITFGRIRDAVFAKLGKR